MLAGDIKPDALVQLSSEELASKVQNPTPHVPLFPFMFGLHSNLTYSTLVQPDALVQLFSQELACKMHTSKPRRLIPPHFAMSPTQYRRKRQRQLGLVVISFACSLVNGASGLLVQRSLVFGCKNPCNNRGLQQVWGLSVNQDMARIGAEPMAQPTNE